MERGVPTSSRSGHPSGQNPSGNPRPASFVLERGLVGASRRAGARLFGGRVIFSLPTGGTADRHARSNEHAAGSASEPLGNLSFVSNLAEPSATCIQSKSRSCNERSAFFFSDIHRRAPRAPLLYAVAPLPSGNTLPDAPVWPRKLPPSKFFHPYGNAPTVSSVRPHAGGLLDHLGRLSLLARPRRCFRRRSGPQHHLPVLERVATALQRISEHTTCAPVVSAPSS